MEKICSVCGEEKPIEEFNKKKVAKDGFRSQCKSCRREYRLQNKEKIQDRHKKYYQLNRKRIIERQKKYSQENKEKISKYRKQYNKANKKKLSGYKKEYNKRKRKEDPKFRVLWNLRNRIGHAIKHKSDSTKELIGCDMAKLKLWLEMHFQEGMTWENYGTKWHIDHYKPCAVFDLTDPEQQKQCFHFTNMRPLWVHQNLSKKDSWRENNPRYFWVT